MKKEKNIQEAYAKMVFGGKMTKEERQIAQEFEKVRKLHDERRAK